MPRLPPLPTLSFDASGLIHGTNFGDSYFSREDGLAETRTVFLSGTKLPQAWVDTSCFVIGELGFGTGLNVLAAWDLWNKTAPSGAVLHIISVEGFLMEAGDAQKAHRNWPELASLSEILIARWPTRAFGTQRIWFEDHRVCVTLLIGPCEQALAGASFAADCWFLDGFAPSKNPDMWSPDVFNHIARLSKPGARLATYSVAGTVRTGLTAVGFDVARVPGFGTKRERLEATFKGQHYVEAKPRPKSAIVIGGGIGGAALCAALARRNIATQLIDPDPCARTKASGNPVALIAPRLDKGDTREGRFYRSAYLMALDFYHQIGDDGFAATGLFEGGEDTVAKARLADLLSDPPLPPSHMQVGPNETILHHGGGITYPDVVLSNLIARASPHPIETAKIGQDQGGQWCAFDAKDGLIAKADICVIAAGTGVHQFFDFGQDIGARAGQLSWAAINGELPEVPVTGAGYGLRFGDRLAFGATYEHWPIEQQSPPAVKSSAHIHNRDVLAKIAPELASQIDLETAHGRTSIRVTTSDQMPIAGPAPKGATGLYVLAGLGSRGFTTAFLCAELIASQACDEPLPVETSVEKALAPDRFAKRRAKKSA